MQYVVIGNFLIRRKLINEITYANNAIVISDLLLIIYFFSYVAIELHLYIMSITNVLINFTFIQIDTNDVYCRLHMNDQFHEMCFIFCFSKTLSGFSLCSTIFTAVCVSLSILFQYSNFFFSHISLRQIFVYFLSVYIFPSAGKFIICGCKKPLMLYLFLIYRIIYKDY